MSIKSVIKIKEGFYKLNDSVILENISFSKEENEITYDLSFDDQLISEQDAVRLCEEFLYSALGD